MEFLHLISTRSALLSAGACLILFGVVVRNFAQTAKRSRDHDKQLFLNRKTLADTKADIDQQTPLWEKRLPLIGRCILILGCLLIGAGIVRGT